MKKIKRILAILIILIFITIILYSWITDPITMLGIPLGFIVVGLFYLCVKWLQ